MAIVKEMITTWNDSKYELRMYLVYEELYDGIKRPTVIIKLRPLLNDATAVSPLKRIWIMIGITALRGRI